MARGEGEKKIIEGRGKEEEVEDDEVEEDGRKGRRRVCRKSGREKDMKGERCRLKGRRRETGEEREKVDEDGSVERSQLKDYRKKERININNVKTQKVNMNMKDTAE